MAIILMTDRWDLKDQRDAARNEAIICARIERAFRFAGNEVLAEGYRLQALEANAEAIRIDGILNDRTARKVERKAYREHLRHTRDYEGYIERHFYYGEPVVELNF